LEGLLALLEKSLERNTSEKFVEISGLIKKLFQERPDRHTEIKMLRSPSKTI